MGWFDGWFINTWFGTVSNVTVICAAETLPTKTTLPTVAVRTDQRFEAGKTPLSGNLSIIAPNLCLGTKPGVGTQTLSATLLVPDVRTVISQCAAVASLALSGATSPLQVQLGAMISTPTATGTVLLAPISVASGVCLTPNGVGGRWSLPQKGVSVVVEI